MKYLILTQPSTAYAEAISAEIWKISKPPAFWQENDVTTKFCGYMVHPSDGRVAIGFPGVQVFVHADSDVEPLVQLVSAPLTQEMVEEFRDQLNAIKGTWGNIEAVLPPVFAANLKDEAFMISDGWFNE